MGLEPTSEGTLLTFTTWLGPDQPAGTTGTAAGWHVCLDQLVDLLDRGSVEQPLVDADTERWEAENSRVTAST